MVKKAVLVGEDAGVPLVVDFDGTMHLNDLNLEAVGWLLWNKPLLLMKLLWIYGFKGRAAMKLRMEEHLEQAGWLPGLLWDEGVLKRIAAEQAKGREVVVVTGSTEKLVKRILAAKGLAYEVVGTVDATVNLVGEHKEAALVKRWGHKKFDYVGNSRDDLKVWRSARKGGVRTNSAHVARESAKVVEVEWLVHDGDGKWKLLLMALRPRR